MRLEIRELKRQNERCESELDTVIDNSDNEIYIYALRDKQLSDQNQLLTKTVSASDLKQTKIKEVRQIVVKTIMSLPNTVDYRAARDLSSQEITRIAKHVVEYSDQYEVPLSLAVALIKHESAFNIRAVSRVGAQGLVQIMPDTAEFVRKRLGKNEYDPWDSQDNIQFGLFYFSTLLDLYRGHPEQYKLAVNAYNAGPGNVFKVLGRETREHEAYVLRYASEFKEQGL